MARRPDWVTWLKRFGFSYPQTCTRTNIKIRDLHFFPKDMWVIKIVSYFEAKQGVSVWMVHSIWVWIRILRSKTWHRCSVPGTVARMFASWHTHEKKKHVTRDISKARSCDRVSCEALLSLLRHRIVSLTFRPQQRMLHYFWRTQQITKPSLTIQDLMGNLRLG